MFLFEEPFLNFNSFGLFRNSNKVALKYTFYLDSMGQSLFKSKFVHVPPRLRLAVGHLYKQYINNFLLSTTTELLWMEF